MFDRDRLMPGWLDPLRSPAAVGAGFFGGGGTPTALIGRGVGEGTARQILDRSLELGLTLIDTANSYGGGESERIIGRWLADYPDRRARVGIIGKLGAFDREGKIVMDLAPATVFRCADESRSRLSVEFVDVLMAHGPDPATPVRATVAAFADLIDRGLARGWGVSNVSSAGLLEWLAAAQELSLPGPIVVENEYSLLTRGDEADVIPLCQLHGIGYLAFSPLAGGVLTGKYRWDEPPPPESRLAIRPDVAANLTEAVYDSVDVLRAHARARNVSPTTLALAWVMRTGPVIRPIVGASRASHLDAVAEAMTLRLSPDEWATITHSFEGAAH